MIKTSNFVPAFAIFMLVMLIPAFCLGNARKDTEDKNRSNWEKTHKAGSKSTGKFADPSKYWGKEDVCAGYEKPVRDFDKNPAPVEKDIKCTRCSGTGIIKTVDNDGNSKFTTCFRCGGKGTTGRTKI